MRETAAESIANARTNPPNLDTSPEKLPSVSVLRRPYTFSMREAEENARIRAPEALEDSGEECELCGEEFFGLHCKLVCPNCGYRRDCSDP
jgi:rubrerythrin